MLALYFFYSHLNILPFWILLLAFFKFYNFRWINLYYFEEIYKPTKLLEKLLYIISQF